MEEPEGIEPASCFKRRASLPRCWRCSARRHQAGLVLFKGNLGICREARRVRIERLQKYLDLYANLIVVRHTLLTVSVRFRVFHLATPCRNTLKVRNRLQDLGMMSANSAGS